MSNFIKLIQHFQLLFYYLLNNLTFSESSLTCSHAASGLNTLLLFLPDIFHSLTFTKLVLPYIFKDLRHHGRSCQSEVGGHVPAVYQCIQGQRSGPTKYPESLGKCGSYSVKGEEEHQRNPPKVRDDYRELADISLYMYMYILSKPIW